jgi:hypothetical protein
MLIMNIQNPIYLSNKLFFFWNLANKSVSTLPISHQILGQIIRTLYQDLDFKTWFLSNEMKSFFINIWVIEKALQHFVFKYD